MNHAWAFDITLQKATERGGTFSYQYNTFLGLLESCKAMFRDFGMTLDAEEWCDVAAKRIAGVL